MCRYIPRGKALCAWQQVADKLCGHLLTSINLNQRLIFPFDTDQTTETTLDKDLLKWLDHSLHEN